MTHSEFRDAFHAHKDVLYRFAYRMSGEHSTAEDVVQESFLAWWRKPQGFDPGKGSLRAFLLGITRNLILKRMRDVRPAEPLDGNDVVLAPVDLEGMERSVAVAKAVGALPALQREALILAEFEEMPLAEIAVATQAELAAVKSRLHRARENLRRSLAPLLDGNGVVYGTQR